MAKTVKSARIQWFVLSICTITYFILPTTLTTGFGGFFFLFGQKLPLFLVKPHSHKTVSKYLLSFFPALKADSSASSVPDRTALILFEDIDLFFGEADEGFYSAVNSLIATTKRPILLTTSKSSFLAMQDSTKSKVLKLLPQAFTFSSVEAEAAARHLQLMALVEGFIIDLNRLVENKAIFFKGTTY